jgi:hypothetical protein
MLSVFNRGPGTSRRKLLAMLAALVCSSAWTRGASGFGQSGIFRVRRLKISKQRLDASRNSAESRWAWELVRRTSASARLEGCTISAQSPQLFDEPFAVWSGTEDPGNLSFDEHRSIDRFLRLGGLLLVDDSNPAAGAFGRAARRELARLVPDSPIQPLSPQHVIFKSFYMLDRPMGRVVGSGRVEAISRGRLAQVLFLDCDLLGALATLPDGGWTHQLEGGDSQQRERAIRFAVNVAMYLLCSDYKDDQVHAAWIMRHRLSPRK